MNIPLNWKAALATVQQFATEAVIGGGCLRDLDNDRPVGDIDIFVFGTSSSDLYHLRQRLIEDADLDCDEIDPDKMYPVGDGNDVVGHFEIDFDGITEPVQIIMVNFECSVITHRFDYGICRISFDGTTLYRSPDYEADKRDKVFRLCLERCERGLAASVHRFARLTRKYEGWRFVPFQKPDPLSGVVAEPAR